MVFGGLVIHAERQFPRLFSHALKYFGRGRFTIFSSRASAERCPATTREIFPLGVAPKESYLFVLFRVRSAVAVSPEFTVGFIDPLKQTAETSRLVNRPSAIESHS